MQEPQTVVLRRRAARHRRDGDHRKAAVALGQLVALEEDGVSWALYGEALRRARRTDEALRAFRQAIWHHSRAGAAGRARAVAVVVGRLLAA